jgi:hypothetical protein
VSEEWDPDEFELLVSDWSVEAEFLEFELLRCTLWWLEPDSDPFYAMEWARL